MNETLTQRRRETERFTAFVNDPLARAYPNERLAIRVAEKNLALAEELNRLLLHLLMAYRSAIQSYAQAQSGLSMIFDGALAEKEIMDRVTRRGWMVLDRLTPKSAPEARDHVQSRAEENLTARTAAVSQKSESETSGSVK